MGIFTAKGRLYYRFQIDGRSYNGSTDLVDTPRNRRKAEQIEATQRTKIEEGRIDKKVEQRLFSQARDEFITWAKSEYREKPNTWKRVAGSMSSLVEFFKKKPVLAIDIGEVERYMQWRREEHRVKEVTLRHDIHNLSVFYAWAKKRGYARENIIQEAINDEVFRVPSDQDAIREHVISVAEEKAFFMCAEKRTHLADSCHIMLEQGLRPEEAWTLEKRGFDAEKRTIEIFKGKSRAAKRKLHCTPLTFAILSHRMTGDSPWFFPSRRNPKQPMGRMNNTFIRTITEANLHFTIYDLRHTFATRAGQSGMDIKTLAETLGHANLRTVARYIHPTDEHKKSAMDRLELYKAMIAAQGEQQPERVTKDATIQ